MSAFQATIVRTPPPAKNPGYANVAEIIILFRLKMIILTINTTTPVQFTVRDIYLGM